MTGSLPLAPTRSISCTVTLASAEPLARTAAMRTSRQRIGMVSMPISTPAPLPEQSYGMSCTTMLALLSMRTGVIDDIQALSIV